jgi:hypothetical protein
MVDHVAQADSRVLVVERAWTCESVWQQRSMRLHGRNTKRRWRTRGGEALDTSALAELGICTSADIFEATLGNHRVSSGSGSRLGRSSAVRRSNFLDVERTIQDLTVSRSE